MPEGREQASYQAILRRVPGLAWLWRRARRLWWLLRDAASAGYWRVQAALPPGARAKHRVSAVWGATAADDTRGARQGAKGWLDCDDVLWRYVFPRFGGEDWYHYVAQRYCTVPRALALSLCCGDGHVEQDLIKYRICDAAEGIDISPEAIAVCRDAAAGLGCDRLSYRVGDIERERLPEGKYDLIVAWMALHHLRRLDHVLRQVARALAPAGVFVANEYVGPPRFQLPRRQVEAANALLRDIPTELRHLPAAGGVKERCDPAPLARMLQDDPSEAVSSHRIIPALGRRLEIVERIDYGGSLLMVVLSGIAQNFQLEDPAHRAVLERLYEAERSAFANGEFSSDFTFLVARPR